MGRLSDAGTSVTVLAQRLVGSYADARPWMGFANEAHRVRKPRQRGRETNFYATQEDDHRWTRGCDARSWSSGSRGAGNEPRPGRLQPAAGRGSDADREQHAAAPARCDRRELGA